MSDPNKLNMDATAILDLDAIEADWQATLELRDTIEEGTAAAFRAASGHTPTSVVDSAEGVPIFPGFGQDANGRLTEEGVLFSAVARAAARGDLEALAGVESQTCELLAAD